MISDSDAEFLANIITVIVGLLTIGGWIIKLFTKLKIRNVWIISGTVVFCIGLLTLFSLSGKDGASTNAPDNLPVSQNTPSSEVVGGVWYTPTPEGIMRKNTPTPSATSDVVIDDYQLVRELIETIRLKGRREALLNCDISLLNDYYIDSALLANQETFKNYCFDDHPKCYMDMQVKSQEIIEIKIEGDSGYVEAKKVEDRVYHCNDIAFVVATPTPAYDDSYVAVFKVRKVNGRWMIYETSYR